MNDQNVNTNRPVLTPVGELFSGAWSKYKLHFNTLVPISLLMGVGSYLIVFGNSVYSSSHVNPNFGWLGLLAFVLYIVGLLWGIPALVKRIEKIDQPMTIGQAFAAAKPYIWPMFTTGLLAGLATAGAFLLLIIPGIIVAVWFTFSTFIVVTEHKRNTEALKTSKHYVQGYWWPVFGRVVLIAIALGLSAAIIGWIAQIILGPHLGVLIQNIVSFILIPFALLYEFDLYKNIQSVKNPESLSNPLPVEAEVE